MRKIFYDDSELWDMIVKIKRIMNVIDSMSKINKDSILLRKQIDELNSLNDKCYNYIVEHNYPIKKIPLYMKEVIDRVIELNRPIDKKYIKKRNTTYHK